MDTKQLAISQGLIPVCENQVITTDLRILLIGHDNGGTEVVDADSCVLPISLNDFLTLRAEALVTITPETLPSKRVDEYRKRTWEAEAEIGKLRDKLKAAEERAAMTQSLYEKLQQDFGSAEERAEKAEVAASEGIVWYAEDVLDIIDEELKRIKEHGE